MPIRSAAEKIAVAVMVAALAVTVRWWTTTRDDGAVSSDPPADATFLSVKGHRVRYTDTGEHDSSSSSSKVVVLVHGFCGCLETWNALIPHLPPNNNNSNQQSSGEQFRVLTLDLVGSGHSDKPLLGFDYSFQNQGVLVADFVRELGLDKNGENLFLVGHSAGGIVVCSAAAALGNNVGGLFLVAPGFFQTKPKIFSHRPFHFLGRLLGRFIRRMLPLMLESGHINAGANLSNDTRAAFEASWNTPNATQALEEMVIVSEEPYADVLSTVTAPVHIVWSEEDRVNPFAAQEIEQLIRDGKMRATFTYTLLKGSGHYIQHDLPQQLAGELTRFAGNGRKFS